MADSIEILECGAGEVQDKRLVAIILKREELLYDIENNCYIEGHIMTQTDDEIRHTVLDVGQEGNVDRVIRILDLAHADIIERLFPFTQRDVEHPVVDDRLPDKPVYGVFLKIPQTFSQTTLNLLGKLIHELLVCTATAEWMSITNPQKEETWRFKVSETLARINQVKGRRQKEGRSRIKGHWL